jgi:hypothetical protein
MIPESLSELSTFAEIWITSSPTGHLLILMSFLQSTFLVHTAPSFLSHSRLCSSWHKDLTATGAATGVATASGARVAAIRTGAAARGLTEGGGGGGARPSDAMAAGKGEGADIVAGAAALVAPLTTGVTTSCMERKEFIFFSLLRIRMTLSCPIYAKLTHRFLTRRNLQKYILVLLSTVCTIIFIFRLNRFDA